MMALIALIVLVLASFATSSFISSLFGRDAAVISQEVFAERSYFYVGGHYVNASVAGGNVTSSGMGTFMTGQIYVERLVPHIVKKKHPLVFIHGKIPLGTIPIPLLQLALRCNSV